MINPEQITKAVQGQLACLWTEQIKLARNQLDVTEHLVEYGTTILIALVYDGYLYLFQLGDGDICFFQKDGAAVFLAPPDPNPTDESTDSLCRPPELQEWHSATLPMEEVDFLTMSTDGLMKSMASVDEYIKLGKQLNVYMEKHRPATLNAVLPEWLEHYSETGAADDTSLIALKPTKKQRKKTMKLKNPKVKIIEKLAEGGQGEIHLAHRDGKERILKLYYDSVATPEQKAIISHLIAAGVPASEYADKFIWPEELVEVAGSNRFGYLMQKIEDRFVSLKDIQAGQVPHPGYGVIAEACRQLACCYRDLHINGYCYRDISADNCHFDPQSGEVRIFDNDNCMVEKLPVGNIEGTAGFMAPEVQRGEASPSIVTDQHSLAVLLFMAWHWHNPLHGLKEYNIKCFDIPAQDMIYGHEPVFIFDPHDRSNALPNAEGYRAVPRHWNLLPTFMRRLFTRAFTKGLHDPSARVTELEWMNAFSRLLDLRYICPVCHAENFFDPEEADVQRCWHKGCELQFPLKLAFKNNPANSVLIKPGKKLTTYHLGQKSSARAVGEMEEYSADQNLCVLRNKTAVPWTANADASTSSVPEGKGIVLYPGIQIQIESYDLIVQR